MKDINFFAALSAKSKKNKKTVMFTLCFLCFLALASVAYLGFTMQLVSINNNTKKISIQINTPQANTAIKQYKTYTDNISALNRYNATILQVTSNIDQTYLLNSGILEKITAAMTPTAKLTYLSYTGNTVSLSFNVQTLQEAAGLIESLKAADIFKIVSCNTYSLVSGTAKAAAGNPYAITIIAVLYGGDAQ